MGFVNLIKLSREGKNNQWKIAINSIILNLMKLAKRKSKIISSKYILKADFKVEIYVLLLLLLIKMNQPII